jgi:hypothetical protein
MKTNHALGPARRAPADGAPRRTLLAATFGGKTSSSGSTPIGDRAPFPFQKSPRANRKSVTSEPKSVTHVLNPKCYLCIDSAPAYHFPLITYHSALGFPRLTQISRAPAKIPRVNISLASPSIHDFHDKNFRAFIISTKTSIHSQPPRATRTSSYPYWRTPSPKHTQSTPRFAKRTSRTGKHSRGGRGTPQKHIQIPSSLSVVSAVPADPVAKRRVS